ncbi:alpha/beta fold hydrolase [Streptomyces yangpuensis]|uniref:alpha/beta fold hydrolase n=1 Tax=Streptomyces yangpuensis TaxID=1648182 RepID=UPI0006291A5C|nr:alpha/beta fold hydrolase [Streptomyces yangpuensis]
MKLRMPRRRRDRLLAGAAALAVVAGGGTWTAASASGDTPAVHRQDQVLNMPGADIDTSYFVAGGGRDGGARRPAVLLGHGFGGSKDDVREQAERLARDGYAVMTWSARGFGRSGGRIGMNDPEHEVKDVSRLVDWLAARPEVRLDAAGDPRVGVSGASYGGAVSLLAAGHDRRVDAIAPEITYWNLADSLFPGGVFKKLWSGIFFTTGSAGGMQQAGTAQQDSGNGRPQDGGGGRPDAATGAAGANADATAAANGGATGAGPQDGVPAGPGCGRFTPELCAMYERVAVAGKPDAEARDLLERRSPSAVADRIKVPALIVQGQDDSLFPLDQADAMAAAIAANGAPVAVDWAAGGHDGGMREADRVEARVAAWFDRHLKGDEGVDTGPAFRVSRSGGIDSTDGEVILRGASGDRYPGLASGPREFPLTGREQTFTNPAGGTPPALSSLPGIGGQLASFGAGLSLDFPGQNARFESAPLEEDLQITGTPTVTLKLRSTAADGSAVLFGKVYDVGPDGRQQVLPSQLVAPLRVENAQQGATVRLRLPAIDHSFAAGHRLRLVVAATDLGYASPAASAVYTVSVDGPLAVPVAPQVRTATAGLPAWTWGLPLGALLLAAALLGLRRTGTGSAGARAGVPQPDPALADVPLQITGLTKRYAKSQDRYAVRDLSFRVEKGQVLGLLGPNGAGKTTTLRMLMGLISPDAGEIRVFGHAVRAGAPVLSRVGAFVEGAGFLPHLTGRANLELYWQATGRPAEDSHMAEALEIAGLGDALERAVRTYSQGMRQRLAIAQAMLGMPDLLILDEPTNGLDPPQIREMRDVMIRYAAGGRTVIVSSHLLSEVEQSCTHLVVMDRGQRVAAGEVAEITGGGDTLLVTLAEPVDEVTVEKVTALEGVGSVVATDDGLLVRLEGATAAGLIAELVRLEVPVTGVGPHRRLEDAFLTLIGGAA